MRPVPTSSVRTSAVLCILVAVAALILGGCGRPWPTPATWGARGEGTVYAARLISEHPLYSQYVRLGQEIAYVQRTCVIPQAPPVFIELGELFLPPPDPPVFPSDEFAARRREWQLTLLLDRPVTIRTLEPDLQAEMNWARLQAQEQATAQLQQVQSDEESYVARVRAEAVKARQEAFNNVGLDLTLSDKDVQAAQDKERERLWAQVEQEVVAARAVADRRVTEARQRISAQMSETVAAAETDVSRRMERRAEIFVKSGSEMRTRLSNAMVPPEPLAMGPGLVWRASAAAAPAGAVEPAVGAMQQREQRLRGAQAAVLAAKRADMAGDLERGVELAVRRLAGLRGIRVHFPPAEKAAGPDLTEELRGDLRQMFKY